MSARYIVGIDLGTTHTVVGYADLTRAPAPAPAPATETDDDQDVAPSTERPTIEVFDVAQLVAPGEVAERPLLPSFRYHVGEQELGEQERQLAWAEPLPDLPTAVVGTLAQRMGGQVPGRLIASAKSWLSHAAVDRDAPILPWGAPEGVAKASPVDASASYLAHVKQAWDAAHPEAPLKSQEVVLTVPASFDEAARALTIQAAKRAGLPKVRLLEEPQAAFYAWLDRHRDELEGALGETRLAAVVDVGGGTTDLTLIQVELRKSGPRLTRIAVGEHLMLGGDNMDLTLARLSEQEIQGEGKQLPAARFSQLLQQCREAKERLLAADGADEVKVTVLGGGSRLIGGSKSASLTRERVNTLVLDGFVPEVSLQDTPQVRRGGLVEFGLPYVADPAITRHLAAFLARHRDVAAEALGLEGDQATPEGCTPDAVLFNGGVFRGAQLEKRVLDVMGQWRGEALRKLDNPEPELAVARGAVAYGLARRGVGLRIGGGSPRSYFMQVDDADGRPQGVCVLPRGSEEGEEILLKDRTFALKVGKPVRFRLWTNASDRGHKAGDLVTLQGEAFRELPAIAAVLEGKPGDGDELQVQLTAGLTEVGTLEMSCVGADDPARRYKLEFQLRGEAGRDDSQGATKVTQLHPRFADATQLVQAFYGKSNKSLEGRKIKTLRNDLEKTLGDRDGWDTALLRELFGALLAGVKRRRRSADHERIWFNLAGYCLRPGLGYPLDDWRVEQVWKLFESGVQFAPEQQVWSQWWILWRRIAGGLDEAQQLRLADAVAYYLEPPGPRPRPRPKGPRMQGVEDMARMVGALERLPAARKAQVGDWLIERMARGELSMGAWWSVGRLGARAPLYGSAHTVVRADVAQRWLQRALEQDLKRQDQAALAAAQLARRTDDRERDLPPDVRERTAQALREAGAHEGWIRLVQEGGQLSEADERRVFGESLPAGLKLL